MALLHVENLGINFGGLRAVNEFNLELEPGQVRGLIGPNGAGKSTVFNLITGIYPPDDGRVVLDGEDLVGLPPHQIASKGLGRTFQNLALWRHMSVLEHVNMAQYSQLGYGLAGALLGTPTRKRREREVRETSRHLLEVFGVGHLADHIVVNLPYGAQRRVEMARAMATRPKVLFLDEPTAGMNPDELIQMMEIIRKVHEEFGVAIFLIEHRLKFVMELCERIQCLVFGEVIAEGNPEEIQNHPKVIEAYLGDEKVD